MVAEGFLLVVRLVVGGMFLVALAGKLRDLPSFRSSLRGFRAVPRHLERPVAAAVLAAEVAVVVLVLLRSTAAFGLALAVVLLVAFATGMLRVLARGDRVPCGCFGRSTAPITRAHVVRNALLATAAAAGAVVGLAAGPEPLDGPVLLVLSLFSAAVIAVLLLSDQLLGVAEPPRRPEPRRHRPVDIPSTGPTRKR